MTCTQFLIDRLAAILERRASASPRAAASGMVINTMGWVEGLGYELQLHAITTLKVGLQLYNLDMVSH
jgi:polyribonucleotide 5'-hydroxyl-kinase